MTPEARYTAICVAAKAEALQRRTSGAYFEGHHIVPKCLGGEGYSRSWQHDNIVKLTPAEHFECHYLLCLMYPDEYGLANAFCLMWTSRGLHPQDSSFQHTIQVMDDQAFLEHQEVYVIARETISKYRKQGRDSARMIGLKKYNDHPTTKKNQADLRRHLNSDPEFKERSSKHFSRFMREYWRDTANVQKHIERFNKLCMVDGVVYKSLTTAAQTLSLSYANLCRRVRSSNYPTYKLL